MILADTSVWVDHFRFGVPRLRQLLLERAVVVHPFVIGELACGNLRDRRATLGLLRTLPSIVVADNEEVMSLVEHRRLWGKGIGWVDAHLLASALLSGAEVWTLDAPLADAARRLGVARAG